MGFRFILKTETFSYFEVEAIAQGVGSCKVMVAFFKKISLMFGGNCLPVLCVLVLTMASLQGNARTNCFETTAKCENGSGDNGSMIAINGYEIQGEYLIINYTIQFPGMTKVKLFDSDSKQLLWRSQYVNDKEGDHRIVLRHKALSSGSYLFEFDYKNQKRVLNISV